MGVLSGQSPPEMASQRYYLPISFPPHRRQVEKCLNGKAMWESRTERRARGGFHLEAAFFAADRLMGMMCPAYGAFLRQGYRKCGEWYRMDTKERGIAANI